MPTYWLLLCPSRFLRKRYRVCLRSMPGAITQFLLSGGRNAWPRSHPRFGRRRLARRRCPTGPHTFGTSNRHASSIRSVSPRPLELGWYDSDRLRRCLGSDGDSRILEVWRRHSSPSRSAKMARLGRPLCLHAKSVVPRSFHNPAWVIPALGLHRCLTPVGWAHSLRSICPVAQGGTATCIEAWAGVRRVFDEGRTVDRNTAVRPQRLIALRFHSVNENGVRTSLDTASVV